MLTKYKQQPPPPPSFWICEDISFKEEYLRGYQRGYDYTGTTSRMTTLE